MPPEAREGIGEDEARRDRRIEEGVVRRRNRGRPVVAARYREVEKALEVEGRLPIGAHEAPLRVDLAVVLRVGVVDRDEVGIEEVLSLEAVRRGLGVGDPVAQQARNREVARQLAPVEVEQRLRADVARDVVGLVDGPVERGALETLRMPENQVLVRVGIDADVGLQVAPGERHHHDAKVRDEPVRLRADDVLLDVEVGIVVFGPLRQRGDATSNALRREEVGCIVRLGPHQEAEEHAAIALERLLVRGVRVLHRQVRLQPRRHLRTRGTRQVEPRVARLRDHAILLHVRRGDAIVHLRVRRASAEREVVLLRQRGLEEARHVVVEGRPSGIGGSEVLERADDAVRGGRRPELGLELRLHARRVEPQAVAVVQLSGAGLAALRRDHDGAVRGIDAVES